MENLIQRNGLATGREMLETFPAVVIEGARQVGKSTLAAMLVADRSAVSFTLDNVAHLDAALADPRAFVEQIDNSVTIIDEFQRLPGLSLAIKASIDERRRPGRFLLTGSSDLLRLPGVSDSLAGRAVTHRLRGLSQGELMGRCEDFVAQLVVGADPLTFTTKWTRAGYAAALARGSFPETQHITPRMRALWLDGYLGRILRRDAAQFPAGGQPARLRSVLALIAANQSGELVKARLAHQSEIPKQSITAYLDVLSSVFLVDQLPPWTPNLTRREIGRPKAAVADSALAMRLNRQTPARVSALTEGTALGGLIEAFAVQELLKQQTWSAQDYALYHFRDRDGSEVDVIIELDDGSVFGVEVKSSSTYKAEQFKGLRELQVAAGSRFRGGIVLGMSDRGYHYAPRLWGLPIAALWEWGSTKEET